MEFNEESLEELDGEPRIEICAQKGKKSVSYMAIDDVGWIKQEFTIESRGDSVAATFVH